jgi:superfamily II DNA or RNA helicase
VGRLDQGGLTGSETDTNPPPPKNMLELTERVQLYQAMRLSTTAPVEPPPSLDCPGLYGTGCQGKLVQYVSHYSSEVYWRCVKDEDVVCFKRRGCGYCYFPKPRLNELELAVLVSAHDKIEVTPVEGAEQIVDFCGGVEVLVTIALINKMCRSIADIGGVSKKKNLVEFPMSEYERLVKCLTSATLMRKSACVPARTKNCFMGNMDHMRASEDEVRMRFDSIPAAFRSALLPFQVDGVKFALKRKGRCLIADEMGVGKTVQALALATCYRDKWPLLIVVPASLRLSWAEEIEKWIPDVSPEDIHIIFDKHDRLDASKLSDGKSHAFPKIVISSYHMLPRICCQNCVNGVRCGGKPGSCMSSFSWKMIISDESHVLRTSTLQGNKDSQYTNCMKAMCSHAEHLIFLTGTPSLNKPFDLYNQIAMLRSDIFPESRGQFADIYCDRRLVPCPHALNGQRYDYSGLSRSRELHLLLKQEVLIRRMKRDVSGQLPEKIRQVIRLPEPDPTDWPEPCQEIINEAGEKEKVQLAQIHRVGIAKCNIACEWLLENLNLNMTGEEPIKFVVFAHHKRVMNMIAAKLDKGFAKVNTTASREAAGSRMPDNDDENDKLAYVRIDGDSSATERQEAVEKFNILPNIRVALLSVKAAGVGLDFSAASAVAFFELPPEAALVRQAEDRVHRRGQKNIVNVYYLCATNTYDERRWQSLNLSLAKVDMVHDGPENGNDNEEANKSTKGLSIDAVFAYKEQCCDTTPEKKKPNIAESSPCSMQEDKVKAHAEGELEYLVIPDSQQESIEEVIKSKESDANRGYRWKFMVSKFTKRVHIYLCDGPDEETSRPSHFSMPLMAASIEECALNVLKAYEDLAEAKERCVMVQGIGPMFIDKSVVPTVGDFREALNNCRFFSMEWNEISNQYKARMYHRLLQSPLDAVIEEEMKAAVQDGETGTSFSRHLQSAWLDSESLKTNEKLLKKYPILKDAELKVGRVTYPKGVSEYRQPILAKGGTGIMFVRLCIHCFAEVPFSESKIFQEELETPYMLFCSAKCEKDFAIKRNSGVARRLVMKRDGGVCAECKLDCTRLIRRLQSIEKYDETDVDWKAKREAFLSTEYPNFSSGLTKAQKEGLIKKALAGQAWQADHIHPVFEGGGQCTEVNLRTLCTVCHNKVTSAQSKKRANERKLLKTKGSVGKNGQHISPPVTKSQNLNSKRGREVEEMCDSRGNGTNTMDAVPVVCCADILKAIKEKRKRRENAHEHAVDNK